MTPEERKQAARDRARAWRLANPEKARENQRRWRENNRDKIREIQRRWRESNPDRVREIRNGWAKRNPEQVKEINRLYYINNADKVKASAKDWRERNPEKWSAILRSNQRKREARKRGLPAYRVTTKDLARILSQPCAVTGCTATDIQADHIIPIARGGSHGIGNLQALCGHHNASKHDRLWIEFRSYLRTRSAA